MTSPIDLSLLPPPDVVETLDYEVIRTRLLADFQTRWPDYGAPLESDPVVKLIETIAYLELTLRARINDAGRAVMLAYAGGANLEHLGALLGVAPLAGETDTAYRARIQAAPEGMSVAGPAGAYRFHAAAAHADVRAVAVDSPAPGEVRVTVLSRVGDGAPANDVLAAVAATLNAEDVRPLTDHVTVQAAGILHYTVEATLEIQAGPDPAIVIAAAETACGAYVAARWTLGEMVARTGVIAALHVSGVRRVTLAAPAADIECGPTEAAYCDAVLVTAGEAA